MTPQRMVKEVKEATANWKYEAVSIGYPGFVFGGRAICDPANLGPGWVGFDFGLAKSFCPSYTVAGLSNEEPFRSPMTQERKNLLRFYERCGRAI